MSTLAPESMEVAQRYASVHGEAALVRVLSIEASPELRLQAAEVLNTLGEQTFRRLLTKVAPLFQRTTGEDESDPKADQAMDELDAQLSCALICRQHGMPFQILTQHPGDKPGKPGYLEVQTYPGRDLWQRPRSVGGRA